MQQEERVGRIGLQGWVERIRDREMPVFGRTVQQVKAVTADENASTARLSSVILQDPALTTKVLKTGEQRNAESFSPGSEYGQSCDCGAGFRSGRADRVVYYAG